jgi:hypothetical protein
LIPNKQLKVQIDILFLSCFILPKHAYLRICQSLLDESGGSSPANQVAYPDFGDDALSTEVEHVLTAGAMVENYETIR